MKNSVQYVPQILRKDLSVNDVSRTENAESPKRRKNTAILTVHLPNPLRLVSLSLKSIDTARLNSRLVLNHSGSYGWFHDFLYVSIGLICFFAGLNDF